MALKITECEYAGRPNLVLEWDGVMPDRAPFSIGIGRAKKILAALPEIKAFVEKNKNAPKRYPAGGNT